MTREEAIQVLQTALTSPFVYGEYAEAIDMAIEALSAEVVHKPDYSYEADMVRRMKEALSAEAEWIPCSERLPGEGGNYLITVADLRLGHNGEHTVTMADFYAKAKKWNSVVDVVAWMPLPDPYREDGEA